MSEKSKIIQLRSAEPFEDDFEQIYTQYFDELYIYAKSLARSTEVAKDAVSEVFFNLYKAKSNLSKIKELKHYLLRSVKNEVIHLLSSNPQGLSEHHFEAQNVFIEKVSPQDVLIEKELATVIQEAIKALPDQCEIIFDMAKNKQMKYEDIANELEVSLSTVKTQMCRAMKSLRKAVLTHYDHHHDNDNYKSQYYYGLLIVLLLMFS